MTHISLSFHRYFINITTIFFLIINHCAGFGSVGHTQEQPNVTLDELTIPASSRIVGGNVTRIDRFPYFVSVLDFDEVTKQKWHACGGSLIAHDLVLSAAHCESMAKLVRIGGSHTSGRRETVAIKEKVNHPRFSKRNYESDFVIFKLMQSSTYPPIILDGSITIPENDMEVARRKKLIHFDSDELVKSSFTVMGYGATNFTSSKGSSVMLETNVTYVERNECKSKFPPRVILPSMLCAFSPNTDACQGDSGGPLIYRDETQSDGSARDIQVGVVSWGVECAHPMYPGVYSRVSYDLPWIEETMCKLSPDLPLCSFLSDGVADEDCGDAAMFSGKGLKKRLRDCQWVRGRPELRCPYYEAECAETCGLCEPRR